MTPKQEIDRSRSAFRTFVTKLYYKGGLINESTQVDSISSSYERSIRPASHTNPVRADGTRAPYPWSKRWANSRAFKGPTIVQFRDGWPYSYAFETSILAPFNMDPDRFCNSADVRWCRRSLPGGFPRDVELLARQRAISKLMDQKAEWGATLGEAAETAKGVSSLCRDTIDFIDGARRIVKGDPRTVVKILRDFGGSRTRKQYVRKLERSLNSAERQVVNRYLEFQFGIKPLVLEIQQSSAVLDELVNADQAPATMKVASGAEVTDVNPIMLQGITPAGGLDLSSLVWRRTRCRISCNYEVEVSRGRTLQQLGLSNTPSVLWELTPFSHLVDYGIGIGDWLKTLFPVEGSSLKEGSITWMQEAEIVASCAVVASSPPVMGRPSYDLEYKVGRIERANLSVLLPGYRPAFKRGLGLTQMGNVLATLRQLTRGILR